MPVVWNQAISEQPNGYRVKGMGQHSLKDGIIRGLRQSFRRPTPRLMQWNTTPPGALRAVLGITPC